MNGQIRSLYDLNAVLKQGRYAWPGGYPLYFITADMETLDFKTVTDNKEEVFAAFETGDREWLPVAVRINWEDETMTCAHTGKPIECAYPSEDNYEEVA